MHSTHQHPLAQQFLGDIEAALDRYTAELPQGCPERLREAMRYSLLGGGKRLRPLLVLFAAHACGAKPRLALPAAAAVEMVHAYSLIHDDLPAMDNSPERRGKPSLHMVAGEAQAILAGDALLTLAFSVLSRDIQPEKIALECCALLSSAAGAAGMVGGQSDDIAGIGDDARIQDIEFLHARKTGAIIEACLGMGALVADATGEQRKALQSYGSALGLAFQVTDDLLDDEEDGGKTGVPSFPATIGAEASREKAKELTAQALSALNVFEDSADGLRELAQTMLARTV